MRSIRLVPAALAVFLLAGCSVETFSRPGTPQEEAQRDLYACKARSDFVQAGMMPGQPVYSMTMTRIEQNNATADCMRAQGYNMRRSWR